MNQRTLWMIISILTVLFLGIFSYLTVATEAENPLLSLEMASSSIFEKPSPGNWIKENQILVYKDRVVILVPNAIVSAYMNTNSMDPSIDSTANGIEIVPQSPEDIHVGDIIAYAPSTSDETLIVHRVIAVGVDDKGWYCITKGDNAAQADGKVRWEMIKYVTVAIVY
ncbi:MAG: S26 family signal peptidase [Candidatus Pacearchaeota archaeon]|nr:S26 family signal peptidase [Candidatus Pacearchaeota archaeon]